MIAGGCNEVVQSAFVSHGKSDASHRRRDCHNADIPAQELSMMDATGPCIMENEINNCDYITVLTLTT